MNRYRSLKDAVLDLDPVLIRTLAAFSIDTRCDGHYVLFRFAFYGPNLDRPSDVEQYPDIEAMLEPEIDVCEEIRELDECDLLGALNSMRIAPGLPGNEGGRAKWVVKTHAGSQGERIAWRNSIA